MTAAPASRGYGPLPLAPGLYPGRVWPANMLRLHLVFPRPMACGAVEAPLRLFDPEGREREGVFVDLSHGLWSACGRILTGLLHPGRVKRGLAARARLGPALMAGEALTLALSPALRAADGGPHGLPDRFPLRIAPPVFGAIPPSAIRRSGNGLRLGGPAPIDALGALAHARLIGPDGTPLRPRLVPHPGGVLHLVPRDGPSPQLRTLVGPALEDCCGNRRGMPFEMRPPAAIFSA
jgi:hypothetical protein